MESACTGNPRTVGSNPTLSAFFLPYQLVSNVAMPARSPGLLRPPRIPDLSFWFFSSTMIETQSQDLSLNTYLVELHYAPDDQRIRHYSSRRP